MTTERGRARAASYPHRHVEEGLDLRIETFALDESDAGSAPNGGDELELFQYGDWDRAHLAGEVRVADGVVEETLPPDERSDPPLDVFLVAECGDSLFRRGEQLHLGTVETDGGAVIDAEVTLARDDYVGAVDVEPVLVRTETGDPADGSYAAHEGLVVADGNELTVHVDEPDESSGNHIPARLKSFAETDVDDRDLFHLRRSPPHEPEIWVNAEFSGVADVLRSDGYHGFRPRMRDVVLSQVAHPAIVELVLWTASDLGDDGEWQYDWQEGVLTDICQVMYDVRDAELVAERVYEDYHEDAGRFVGEVNSAVQKHLEPDVALEVFVSDHGPR